ncbi:MULTISPECIES: hypothetical protein [unclassified Gordonia (in: high G+C Gram-positive bacteria)]|uniref:hypothetical protein n=1 Tax=unclassified Gordonia (in: high G+C Gram-positive bacteria) TaxID=2657482 RepID=UPI001F0EC951|nr:hypothetical protein [Gordonia sp. ABSL49_1]MCH5641246.1 hypothetical protein [Gordonia sp. ABSL49_1]
MTYDNAGGQPPPFPPMPPGQPMQPGQTWGPYAPPPPRRSRTGLIIGIVLAAVVVVALVAGGVIWAVLAASGNDDESGFSDKEYTEFAGQFVTDFSTSTPTDQSGYERAIASTCPGSSARTGLENARETTLQLRKQIAASAQVQRTAIDSENRTPDAVPVIVVFTVTQTTSSGPTPKVPFTMEITVEQENSDLCVAKVDRVGQ